MKKIFFILSILLIFVTGVKSAEIYLNCSHKYKTTTQISLSYNTKDNSGKEYVGQGLSMPYTLKLTDSDITLIRRGDDGKIFRSWNINRFNGDAELYSSISSQLNPYSCSKATKKLQ